jgi:hypothetical protein
MGPRAPQPEALARPAPTGTEKQAAAAIKGSRFTGDAARRFKLPTVTEHALDDALGRLARPGSMLAEPAGEPRVVAVPTSKGPVRVRVEIGEVEIPPGETEVPPAQYKQTGSEYVVRVAPGTPAESVERALAHEFAEIGDAHGAKSTAPDVLLPLRAKIPNLEKEFHDLAGKLEGLSPDDPNFGVEREKLLDQARRTIQDAGLAGESPAARARQHAAADRLDNRTKTASDQARPEPAVVKLFNEAAESARPRISPHDRGRLAEADVLGRRLNDPELGEADRASIRDEAKRLATELGLSGTEEAAQVRRNIAAEGLSEDARALMESAAQAATKDLEAARRSGIGGRGRSRSRSYVGDPGAADEQTLKRVAAQLELSGDDLAAAEKKFRDEGGHGRRPESAAAKASLRNQKQQGFGNLEGHVLESSLAENVTALNSVREWLKDWVVGDDGLAAVLGVRRGGAFLAEAAAFGDPQLAEAIKGNIVEKAEGKGVSQRTARLKDRIEQLIAAGRRRFAVVEYYMGGGAAGEFKAMYEQILSDPRFEGMELSFQSVWMRETLGFESEFQGIGVSVGPLKGAPKPEFRLRIGEPAKSLAPGGFIHEPAAVNARYVLGDDMESVLGPATGEYLPSTVPIRIFNSEGKIVRTIEVGTPDPASTTEHPLPLQSTRDILIRLLNGQFPWQQGGSQ